MKLISNKFIEFHSLQQVEEWAKQYFELPYIQSMNIETILDEAYISNKNSTYWLDRTSIKITKIWRKKYIRLQIVYHFELMLKSTINKPDKSFSSCYVNNIIKNIGNKDIIEHLSHIQECILNFSKTREVKWMPFFMGTKSNIKLKCNNKLNEKITLSNLKMFFLY